MNYRLIRSKRKTIALEIGLDLILTVRAPLRTPQREIDRVLREKADWIQSHMEQAKKRAATRTEPSAEDEARCRAAARAQLPSLLAKYAPIVGVQPAGITITGARTRFGSCSSKQRLSFSWRLWLHPEECVEYVVVHELCHILHMDHSAAFWQEVERVLPDYRQRQRLLKSDA